VRIEKGTVMTLEEASVLVKAATAGMPICPEVLSMLLGLVSVMAMIIGLPKEVFMEACGTGFELAKMDPDVVRKLADLNMGGQKTN
jgi:hypothetical protein